MRFITETNVYITFMQWITVPKTMTSKLSSIEVIVY